MKEKSTHRLPFHPQVLKLLGQYPLVLITPSLEDSSEFGSIINHKALVTKKYAFVHNMQFGILNRIQKLECQTAAQKQLPQHPTRDLQQAAFKHLADEYHYMNNKTTSTRPVLSADMADRSYVQNMADDSLKTNESREKTAESENKRKCEKKGCKDNGELVYEKISFFKERKEESMISLELNKFESDPRSLTSLSVIRFLGVETAFLFIKMGFAHFNLHTEQECLCFYHHQLQGDTTWIVIDPADHDKLLLAIRELVRLQNPKIKSEEDEILMAQLFILAKNSFPSLELLRKHGVHHEVIEVHGQKILIGRGDLGHCGFGTGQGETIAFACNILSSEWLEWGGPQRIKEHFDWVKKLAMRVDAMGIGQLDQLMHSCSIGLQAETSRRAALKSDIGEARAALALAINHCPPNHSCSLLKGLLEDLRLGQDCKGTYHAWINEENHLNETIDHLESALHSLHECDAFMRVYYQNNDDPLETYQCCTCR